MTIEKSFFAVDRRSWSRVCKITVGHAAAYLVLARGTGADNMTTSWSANAIETYTGISRANSKAYIEDLVRFGIITKSLRTPTLPKYVLNRSSDIGDISDHVHWVPKGEVLEKPEMIWLPNSIVDGLGREIAPTELLRQTQNLDAMRLFVNLYFEHRLDVHGGVDWRISTGELVKFSREKITDNAQYSLWGFLQEGYPGGGSPSFWYDHLGKTEHLKGDQRKKLIDDRSNSYFASLRMLQSLGLIEIVPHLIEGDEDTSEIICPIPFKSGEPGEQEIHASAMRAADALMPDWAKAKAKTFPIVVPVLNHFQSVTVIGIIRMKYRPQTEATAQWLSNADKWEMMAMNFEKIAEKALKTNANSKACDIKDISRIHQG